MNNNHVFGYPLANFYDHVLFYAQVGGLLTATGLFLFDPAGPTTTNLVKTGDNAPGGGALTKIASPIARRMAAAIDQAGVIFQTGYFMRGQPVHLFLREQIQQSAFGKITRIRHSNCHAGSLKHWFDTDWRWMTDLAQSGVGAYGDLGTHSLDILMWLMGDVARVTAAMDVAVANYGP